MKWAWIAVAFAVFDSIHAAPVTTWVTNTYVTDADGSTYVYNTAAATLAAGAVANPARAITTTTSSIVVSGSESGLSALITLLDYFLSALFGYADSSATSSSSTDSTIKSLASPSTTIIASAASTASVNALLELLTGAKSSSATKTASTAESTETGSSSGLYSEIYDSGNGIDVDFAKAILDSHNSYRALHDAPALSWSQAAYDYAENNAENYDCSGVLTHTHGQYGENLAAGYSSGPASVKAWYDEGDTYDYSSADTYNHFTQVVWKSTTQLGCAYKDCRSKGWGLYVICEYDPPGNVIGEEKENVLE